MWDNRIAIPLTHGIPPPRESLEKKDSAVERNIQIYFSSQIKKEQ
jgi:hypothetical protein